MSTTAELKSSTIKEFFHRARATAEALDEGKPIKAGITITFEDPEDFARFMSRERLRIVRFIREHPGSVKEIARGVRRKPDAVAKDISILHKAGLVRVCKVKNPRHGLMNYVEPVADRVTLETVI